MPARHAAAKLGERLNGVLGLVDGQDTGDGQAASGDHHLLPVTAWSSISLRWALASAKVTVLILYRSGWSSCWSYDNQHSAWYQMDGRLCEYYGI